MISHNLPNVAICTSSIIPPILTAMRINVLNTIQRNKDKVGCKIFIHTADVSIVEQIAIVDLLRLDLSGILPINDISLGLFPFNGATILDSESKVSVVLFLPQSKVNEKVILELAIDNPHVHFVAGNLMSGEEVAKLAVDFLRQYK
jgi:hypothetical protein